MSVLNWNVGISPMASGSSLDHESMNFYRRSGLRYWNVWFIVIKYPLRIMAINRFKKIRLIKTRKVRKKV